MKKLCLLLFLLQGLFLHATHNRAGEITYKHVSGLTYEFTFTIYADPTLPAFQRRLIEVNWGDNTGRDSVTQTRVIPITTNVSRRDFVSRHTFPAPGNYTVSINDPNRNAGIDNIDNSSAVPFYVESLIRISPLGNFSNNSPELLNPPIDNACLGQVFIHNPGAVDEDGDSLVYLIARSKGIAGRIAPGYVFPPAASNVQGNTGSGTISVNSSTGDLIWDLPSESGTYNVAIKIQEYRNGFLIGEVVRDMQINVFPGCGNRPPEIITNQAVCVETNTQLKTPIEGRDPDAGDLVSITANGEPFRLAQNPAVFNSGQPLNPNRDTLYWNTTCQHVRLKPYRVSVKAADDNNFQLTTFETIDITVIAPAPRNFTASSFRDQISLNWSNSSCTDAIGYHLYRRFDSSGFVPVSCQTGVPESTGYRKIATLDGVQNTSYVDNDEGSGLIPGRRYCYLVTAYFEDGAESYASSEVCAEVEKFVPIITNVSVLQTDRFTGQIELAWSPPDSIDSSSFPPPYRYLIYEVDQGSEQLIDSTLSLIDTTYVVNNINTQSSSYKYQIKLFSYGLGKTDIGSSPRANSIFLSTTAADNRVELNWSVNVPWQNDSFIVFRQNLPNGNYNQIAVVDTTSYLDEGLSNGTEFCYYVLSYGAYNLNSVKSPLINASQISCATPEDTEPPCAPQSFINSSCDSNFVDIRWQDSLASCANDIVAYRIYRSETLQGEYQLIEERDANLPKQYSINLLSIAGCYKVTAVDSVGLENTTSNEICVDYCPRYELPNIFTPNGDGINDLFVPFPDYRYVDSIELVIFNRWGAKVFETTDPDILWDGVNQTTSQKVKEGVFFYNCIVYERSLEGLKPRTIRGTVNVQNPNGTTKSE